MTKKVVTILRIKIQGDTIGYLPHRVTPTLVTPPKQCSSFADRRLKTTKQQLAAHHCVNELSCDTAMYPLWVALT